MSTPCETRLTLMQTATELIWGSNYDKVGIAEICKKAGVTKGAFYHHFSSKSELFICACQYDWECVREDMDEVMSPRYSAAQQLERIFEVVLGTQCRPGSELQICGCPFFTAGAQAGGDESEIKDMIRELSDTGVLYFAALTRNLQAEGCLQSEVDALQTGRNLHQFVQGLMMHGRILQDLEQFKSDLRYGMYQLLGVKPHFRKTPD